MQQRQRDRRANAANLLRELRRGDPKAPVELLRENLIEERGVRAALLGQLKQADSHQTIALADTIGVVGADGAEELLLQKLSILLRASMSASSSGFDVRFGAATAVARALLRLRPDSLKAVAAIRRIAEHRNPTNRGWVAATVGSLLVPEARTRSATILRSLARGFVRDPSDEVFALALPAILQLRQVVARRRIEQLLGVDNITTRGTMIFQLTRFACRDAPWALETLHRRLQSEPSERLRGHLAEFLGALGGSTP